MAYTIHLGDCRDILATLPAGSVDAVVTDPPAGIGFMGRAWDHHRGGRDTWVPWLAARLAEARRVVKPGGFMLCWALPRTSHWTALAIEEAGWTIRDKMCHLFGTGFPKSKSCLKPGHEEWILAKAPGPLLPLEIDAGRIGTEDDCRRNPSLVRDTPAGMGIGLEMGGKGSPSGRWPANVCLSHHPDCVATGTRRVRGSNPGGKPSRGADHDTNQVYGRGLFNGTVDYADADGLETVDAFDCHPDCPVRMLGEQTSDLHDSGNSGRSLSLKESSGYSGGWGDRAVPPTFGDSGTAARFFYTSKCSSADRNEGLEGMPRVECQSGCGGDFPTDDKGRPRDRFKTIQRNTHPTVKSTDLMRWLCRLVTPPDGTVLDPFMGSGSTGKACVREGFSFLGIESDPVSFATAERRIAAARAETPLFDPPAEMAEPRPHANGKGPLPGQLGLFPEDD